MYGYSRGVKGEKDRLEYRALFPGFGGDERRDEEIELAISDLYERRSHGDLSKIFLNLFHPELGLNLVQEFHLSSPPSGSVSEAITRAKRLVSSLGAAR